MPYDERTLYAVVSGGRSIPALDRQGDADRKDQRTVFQQMTGQLLWLDLT